MVRIVTDSTSDITLEQAAELGVEIVPLSVHFGEETFIDGVTISNEEFFSRLTNGDVLPKTSQATPYAFSEVYKKYIEQGDEVISIHISTKLSGTCQSATIAAEDVGEGKVSVIDSLNATGGLNLLVRAAVMLRDEGKSREEIVATLNDYIERLMLFVSVDTLEYLKKGGRIKPSLAVVGEVLSLHPILNLTEGEVVVPGKVIGDKAIYKWMEKKLSAVPAMHGLPVLIGHAASPERAQNLKDRLDKCGVEGLNDTFVKLGSVIGTYTGPGAVGVFYIAEKKPE